MSPARSRREWLADALGSVVGIGLFGAALAGATAVERRPVSGFQSLLWRAAGELLIEQTDRERLTVEAEPAVLARIVTEVRQGQLVIAFSPGSVQTRQPIRFRLELKALSAFESQGSGNVRAGPLATPRLSLLLAGSDEVRLSRLQAQDLDIRLEGSGDLAIETGQVERQHVAITGAGNYAAPGLRSRDADVAIDGSGEVRLAVSERLAARISGSGDVLFVGRPRITQSVTGSGEVRRLGGGGR